MTDSNFSKWKVNTNISFGGAREDPVVDSGDTVVVIAATFKCENKQLVFCDLKKKYFFTF